MYFYTYLGSGKQLWAPRSSVIPRYAHRASVLSFFAAAPAKSTFARGYVSGRPGINKLLGGRKGVDVLAYTTSTE